MSRLPRAPVLPLLCSALALCACGDTENLADRADLAKVTRGPLTVSVTESGEIKAAKSTLVKNEMEGNCTIIYLIDEGSIVEKGELMVELDSSSLVERRSTQEIAVERAVAAVISARKTLDILQQQVEANNRAAENKWEFAKMDKRKFYGDVLANGEREMGEREQSIKAGEAEIALAESALKLAEDRFQWSRKLSAKEFITQEELDRDRLDFESKETALKLARNRLAILEKYTHAKTQSELDQAEKDARLELDRTTAQGQAELAQATADLAAKIKEEELAKERLQNLELQIKNARVLAPTPGIVVYASEGHRWHRRTVEIGTQVRERQTLIILPDTSDMQAELKVQEVMIDKIRPGLPALITIDTMPQQPLRGTVLRRAPLPDSSSGMANPDLKEYKTVVQIEGNNEAQVLRPNMSATVEIIIAVLDDVLSVPQQAVQAQGVVRYVWLPAPEGPVARRIETGDYNESRVVVTSGLAEGELVYLVEPAGVKPPEYEQPDSEVQKPVPPAAADLAAAGGGEPKAGPDQRQAGDGEERPRGRPDAEGGGRERAGGPGFAALRQLGETFKAAVKVKNPDLHAQIEGNRGWFRDPEIQAAIEADASLAGDFAAYRDAMRKAMAARPRREGGEDRPRRDADADGEGDARAPGPAGDGN